MIEIKGAYSTAKIFTDNVEGTAISQIELLCSQPFVKDCKIRIMPDVHSGVGSVIGFTANLGEIVANISPTSEIVKIIKPLYNFKASE